MDINSDVQNTRRILADRINKRLKAQHISNSVFYNRCTLDENVTKGYLAGTREIKLPELSSICSAIDEDMFYFMSSDYKPLQTAHRLAESKPELDKLHDYLVEVAPTVLPKSSLGTSIAYTLNHWEGLTNYLKDGRLAFDNNGTERENKSFAIGRKNYLFADTVEGAIALCNLFSIVRTAILHELDPYQYLVTLFEGIPYCETVEDFERLLPWNINLNRIQALTVDEVA